MIRIAMPHPDDIILHWNEIEPFIQLAVDESNGELTTNSVKAKVEAKELAIATVFDDDKLIAAVSFDIINFDSGMSVLNIQCAGGTNVNEWFEQIEAIAVGLAKQHNCSKVYIIGRAGWVRKMKHLGYHVAHAVLTKEVV